MILKHHFYRVVTLHYIFQIWSILFIEKGISKVNLFFFEPHRGSRGLPLVFLDCFMYFFHFRISGVATYEPSLGPFFGSKEKKPLNLHISKSLLAPIWLFSWTLQNYPSKKGLKTVHWISALSVWSGFFIERVKCILIQHKGGLVKTRWRPLWQKLILPY